MMGKGEEALRSKGRSQPWESTFPGHMFSLCGSWQELGMGGAIWRKERARTHRGWLWSRGRGGVHHGRGFWAWALD